MLQAYNFLIILLNKLQFSTNGHLQIAIHTVNPLYSSTLFDCTQRAKIVYDFGLSECNRVSSVILMPFSEIVNLDYGIRCTSMISSFMKENFCDILSAFWSR